MTLQRWFEGECGNSNTHGSWCIVRGTKLQGISRSGKVVHDPKANAFVHDDDGTPFMEFHHYYHGRQPDTVSHMPLPDREKGARKRLAKILAKYPGLQAYVQGDPRGCALYILRPGDIRDGLDVSTGYTNGIAVHHVR